MNKTAITILGIIIVILALWKMVYISQKDENDGLLKIGVIAPLSGPIADYGEEIRKGVTAGMGSSTVQIIFEDDKCDPKEAVSAFKKLTEFQGVNFIIGPACGSSQEAIVSLLKNKQILTIVPAAASTNLFSQSGNNFFNIQYSLEDESKFVAEQMTARGHKKIALLSYANAFSQTHANSFRKNFSGTIALDEVIIDENADLSPTIIKIKAAQVDAIYSPDVSFFFGSGLVKLNQQRVIVPVYSTYVVELPAARDLVSGVVYSFPGDLTSGEGAVYGLSRQAAEILKDSIVDCHGNYSCVSNNLQSNGSFNLGVYQRPIILKQIKEKVPVVLQ